ncbi:hypothetical protein HI914_01044 [Erysiphe necator]|nr:hypothetical protein HI914_01044 [Erysiphe necator]
MSTSSKTSTGRSNSEIPDSYIVALVLGMAVLVITCVSLCVLAFSVKRKYRRQKFCEAIPNVNDDDDEIRSFFIGNDPSEGTSDDDSFHVPKARQQTEWHAKDEKGYYILDI